jgi:hypothetical protein
MKKWLLCVWALSLSAYNVTSDSDSGAGSLRTGFTGSHSHINFTTGINGPAVSISYLTPYTLLTSTTLTITAGTGPGQVNIGPSSTSNGTFLNMGTFNLTIDAPTAIQSPNFNIGGGINTGSSTSSPNTLTWISQDSSSDYVSGSMTGTGNVVISGGGGVSLENNASIAVTGNVNISSGSSLNTTPNSSITSDIVNHGTFTGTGTVNSVDVKPGGRVKPGNSIGTITATGNVTHRTGSFLQIEINPIGNSSLHDVGGTFTIEDGVTFEVVPQAGDYTTNRIYPSVSADGGIVGSFDTITEINPDNIVTGAYFLEHLPNDINLHFFASNCTPIFLVANLSEQASNFQANILSYENDERIMLWDRACNTPPQKYQGYIVADYANGHTTKTDRMIGSDYQIGGFQLGTNIMVRDNILTSAYFGYSRATSKSYNNCSSVDSNNYTGGFLAQIFALKVCSMDLSVMYTRASFDAKRIGANYGSPGANLLNSQFRVIFDKAWKKIYFRPILGMRYLGNWVDRYEEKDEKLDRLTYGSDSWNELDLLGGLLISRTFKTENSTITPHIKGEWTERVVHHTHTVTFDHHQRLYLAGKAKVKNEDDGYLNVSAGISGTLRRCITIDGTYAMSFFQNDAPSRNYRLDISWNY